MLSDKNAVLQVIGALLKRPQYLSETEKYCLTTDDFTSSFEKIIFSSIYNLYLNGAEKVSRIDIDNYLKDFPSSYQIFSQQKGLDYLSDAEFLAQEDNFPYYYKRIKKFSCLRQLKKMGYDIKKIYDDNPLSVDAKKTNEKFDQLEVSDIFNLLKRDLMQIESSFNSNETNETREAFSGLESLIENLQNEPEIGAKLQGEIFNTIVKGARKGKYYIRSLGTGVGKAIPNYTVIPTLNGYQRVDKIKVGDYLFDRLGNPTKVLAVYPQKERKKIFKVYFKSGRVAECCDEHLWSYYKNTSGSNKLFTSSLKELIKLGNLQDENGEYRYSIPICKPLKYNKKRFDVPPYILGLILGREDFKNENKIIPSEYMFGDINQRFDLLAGLLKTNSFIDNKGTISFSSTSEKIVNQMLKLCDSLGIVASIITTSKDYYHTNKKLFTILINCDEEITSKLFKSTQKRGKNVDCFRDNKETKQYNKDSIIKIEETDNYAKMTCFYVDNKEHLFLTDRCIVTHNTRNLVGDACHIAYPIRYNSLNGTWEYHGNSEKTLFIATEQSFDEIQTLILAYLTDINEDRIILGNYTEDEKVRLQKAIYIMNEYKNNFLISRIPNPDITQIKSIVRQNYIVHNIENVFYDYIFSSPSLLTEFRDLRIREDVSLMMLSTALKDLAVELNIFVMTATQLNADAEDKKGIKNQACIRGSKSIIDKADVACIGSKCTQDELNILNKLIQTIGKAPNQVYDIYKVRRGRWTDVKVWSYMDLGTCRKEDLFITDGNLNNVFDFQIQFTNVEFEQDFDKIAEIISKINSPDFTLNKEPSKKKEWIELI